jgi:hypothetical protein
MAKQEIIAVNKTGSAITLEFTGGLEIPAGIGQEVLLSGGTTGTIDIRELQKSQELYDLVTNGDVVLKVDAVELTQAESLSALEELLLISSSSTPEFELRDAVSHKDLTNNPHNVLSSDVNVIASTFFPFTQETSSGAVNPFLTTTQKTEIVGGINVWKTVTVIPMRGTNQASPINIYLRSRWVTGTGNYDVRMVDVDNGSIEIVSLLGLTDTVFTTYNLGTVSNISATPVNWEFQLRVNNQQSRDVELLYLQIDF